MLTAILLGSQTAPFIANNPVYDGPFRPQFHFTPQKNWMNDPNGLVYYEGKYHMFFQYNPFGNEWGHMSWGHAVSTDMVHWKELPVAIPEGNGVMIFSGSAVVDRHNSSGFCKRSSSGDDSCLVAIYTGHNGKVEDQNLAYSNDLGRTWIKYSGNPVINLHLANFRDPKVFWYAPEKKWVMVAALAAERKVRLFSSTDLKHWSTLSDFGPAGAVGGAWECPDLFELPVDTAPGQTRWVLSVNVGAGGAGRFGNQYFVGRFDGTNFVDENPLNKTLWVDYGKDFYASTTFSDIPPPNNRRIMIGWLDDWEYAARAPTSPWRGIQSIPRVLRLWRFPQGLRLAQHPVAELNSLLGHHVEITNQSVAAANSILKDVRGDTLYIEGAFSVGNKNPFGIVVRKGASQQTVIGFDPVKMQLFVDRTRSGDVNFDPKFPGRQTAPLKLANGQPLWLHIFVDRCSVEVFANGGERVISELIFPSPSSQGVALLSKDGNAKVQRLIIWTVKSAWQP